MTDPNSEGFRPSAYEEWLANNRRNSYQDYMEWAYMNNARVHQAQRIAAHNIGGMSGTAAYNWIHNSKNGQMTAHGAAMMQHAGMLGSGSFVDLAFNVQRGMSGAGGYMTKDGSAMMHAGSGQTNDILSGMMYSRFNEYFFAGGQGVGHRALGRDPTQMSKSFLALSNSGAFGGLEMGEMRELSLTERMDSASRNLRSNGKHRDADRLDIAMQASDPAKSLAALKSSATKEGNSALVHEIGQIEKTTHGFDQRKTDAAFKVISGQMKDLFSLSDSLQDVFGELEDSEVLRTTTRLTGIGPGGNLRRARAMIEGMKNVASSLGVSHQEYLNNTMMHADMYQAAGMGYSSASAFASATTASTHRIAKMHMAGAGIRTREGEWNYFKPVTADDVAQQNARDAAGLASEAPHKLAREMMYRIATGDIDANDERAAGIVQKIMTGTDEERRLGFAEANAYNQEKGFGEIKLNGTSQDNIISNNKRTGSTWASYKAAEVQLANQRAIASKTQSIARSDQRYIAADSETGDKLMSTLYTVLDEKTRLSLVDAIKGGGDYEQILKDVKPFLERGGTSVDETYSQIRKLSGEMGSEKDLGIFMDRHLLEAIEDGSFVNVTNTMDTYSTEEGMSRYGMGKAQGNSKNTRTKKGILQKMFNAVLGGEAPTPSDHQDIIEYASGLKGAEAEGTLTKDANGQLTMDAKTRALLAKDKDFMGALGLENEDDLAKYMEENKTSPALNGLIIGAIESGQFEMGTTSANPDSLSIFTSDHFERVSDMVTQQGLRDIEEKAGFNPGALKLDDDKGIAEASSKLKEANFKKWSARDALKRDTSTAAVTYDTNSYVSNIIEFGSEDDTLLAQAFKGALDGDTSGLAGYFAAKEAGAFKDPEQKRQVSSTVAMFGKKHSEGINKFLTEKGIQVTDDTKANAYAFLENVMKQQQEQAKTAAQTTHENVTFNNAKFYGTKP